MFLMSADLRVTMWRLELERAHARVPWNFSPTSTDCVCLFRSPLAGNQVTFLSHKNITRAAWQNCHTRSTTLFFTLTGRHLLGRSPWRLDIILHLLLLRLCHSSQRVLVNEGDKLFSTNPLCASWWLTISGNGSYLAQQISPRTMMMQHWHFSEQ